MDNHITVTITNGKRCLVFIDKITHIGEDENGKAIICFGSEKVICEESFSEILHEIKFL